MLIDLKDLTLVELEEKIVGLEQKKFRAVQIYEWLYRGAKTYQDMTNVPQSLKDELSKHYCISSLNISKKQVSKDGTVKYLFSLRDGYSIESVVMQYKHGYSICISTQVGCNMGCVFCASTIGGKARDLSAGEIIEQILIAQDDLKIRISNVVLMGMGEPLDNFDNVVKFLINVNDKNGLNIGYRHISLSTCGIIPKIYELAKLGFPITLSISLHSPFNDNRTKIMPVNKKYPIKELITAVREYIKCTQRRVSFEYTLIEGVNDSDADAKELYTLLNKMLCHINLIGVNSTQNENIKRPNDSAIIKFKNKLEKYGLNVTIRRELGADIDGACGQLRQRGE